MTTEVLQTVGPSRNPPERVLVLGSTGMLGRSWVRLLEREGLEHTALSRPEFDLSDRQSIERALDRPYGLVVNAAAWTDVDGAESNEAGAAQANAHAVEQVATRCRELGATLITYSTDYVFDGQATQPYPIDAPIHPVNAYGRSKAMGEALLRQATPDHLLIRTSWVYAPWGKNFVLTMMKLMGDRDQLSVVDDQRGRPTSATHLAAGSLAMYLAGATGNWHLTDSGECTWFEFAQEIKAVIGARCTIEPCSSDAFPRPAKRPSYSTLDLEPTRQLLGEIGEWQNRLRECIQKAHGQQ
ncbi:MAG: dTDP-4-dehydrorhamnose reductase [Phycisphaerales bacterium JB052]